jgi:hypothetical protein
MKFTIDGKSVEPKCPVYPDDTIEALQGKLNVGPVYLYAKKRRTLTTRQLYGMFDGAVITRAQVRAVLGNLRHLDQDTYTYGDLIAMNLEPDTLEGFQYPVAKSDLEGLLETLQVTRDLTKTTYTYHDLLDLALDGTYDMYVSLGQYTPPGVPVKPQKYLGDAEARSERKRVLLEYLPLVDDHIWGVTTAASSTYLLKPPGKYVNLDSVRPDPAALHVGFTQLKVVVDTRYNQSVPLDYAFRLLHATDALKLLRLNAVEPRVRVYAPTQDASGNKIPATRVHLRAGKSGDSALTCLLGPMTVTFFVTGAVEVQWSGLPHTPDALQKLVDSHINPFVHTLNSTMQWGVPDAPSVEAYFPKVQLADARIVTSTLQILTPVSVDISIPDGSLLLHVFATDGDHLVYKRVSNFNMYDSAQQILRREGVDALPSLVRLGLSESEAREALETFADSGARKTAGPGIPVRVEKRANGTLFELKNVDHFGYVAELLRYVTALFQPNEPDYISEDEYISEDSDQEGGGDDPNRRLSNDFFALSRLKTRAAVTNKTSKQCLKDKMPIALTPEEYAAIETDPTNPDPFNLVETKDGIVNPPLHHNGNYYICPRYWDMAHKGPKGMVGAPMSERRFREEGHKDRLIGPDEERAGYADDGKDIYEFLRWHENTSHRKYTLVSDKSYELDPAYSWMRAAVSKKNPVPCCYATSHVPKDAPTKLPTRVQTAQTGLLKPGSRGAIPSAIAAFLGKATWFRQGVEGSFLSCLAAYEDQSVDAVKRTLLKRAKSKFQTLQNGNLPVHFAHDPSNQFRQKSPEDNFIAYVKNEDPDFTFLWDLVAMDLNLVIFNGDNHTGRVELICPTNYFSKTKFDPSKFTILMLKQGRGYEPIWQEKIVQEKSVVLKQFHKSNFLEKIRKLYDTQCTPIRKYSTAAEVAEVVSGTQLMHKGKVVGILGDCHVPCYPSAPLPGKAQDVNDAPPLTPEKTRAYLEKIAAKGIVCAPRFQVVVGKKCVGLMTETLQFVKCLSRAPLEMPRYEESFQHEWEYASASGRDPELQRASHRVVETRLYSACRTVLRDALKNRRLRTKVTEILSKHGPKSGELFKLVKQCLHDKVEYHDTIPDDVVLRWSGGRLHLLKRNRVTGHPNNYVARLADELERFPHLRAYLLDEQTIVDYVVHDVVDTELLLSETQWMAYTPSTPLLVPSPYYTLNTYDTIVQAGTDVAFKVERVGRIKLERL